MTKKDSSYKFLIFPLELTFNLIVFILISPQQYIHLAGAQKFSGALKSPIPAGDPQFFWGKIDISR